jgi:hypothetical protein
MNKKRELTYPTAPLHPTLDGRPIPNGAHRSVKGSKGRWYTVCNHGGQLFCDCPAFAFANPPKPCKHIRELRAEEYGEQNDDATTTIQPQDIKVDGHLWDTFGHYETEVSAAWIVRFLANRGEGWVPFTLEDINAFYKAQRKSYESFTFNRLLEGKHIEYHVKTGRDWVKHRGHIEKKGDLYYVLDSFVEALAAAGSVGDDDEQR